MKVMNINEMEAGREMDAAVHREIFNKSCHSLDREILLPHYSTDIAAAWLVVEKMKVRFSLTSLKTFKDGKWLCRTGDVMNVITLIAETAPLAICRTALIAVRE